MKVYAKTMVSTDILLMPVLQDLGVEVQHRGRTFTLSEDNHGNLILRCISDTQLILKPTAANSVEVTSECYNVRS